MAVIDIGPGATSRASYMTAISGLSKDNPANDTGILDTFEIYAVNNYNISGAVIGTLFGSGTDYTSRDYESIGSVYGGSKQTFTGKNCDVESGDFLGIYYTSGRCYKDTSGYSGIYTYNVSFFDAKKHTLTAVSGDAISIYATGETVAAGNPYYYYLQQ